MKPIIGIVGIPNYDIDNYKMYEFINKLVDKVIVSGGIPIGILPTQIEDYQDKKISDIKKLTDVEKEDLNESLKICDAIIKPGAVRIYGFERYIYDYVFSKDMPYIGICAGMQLMANYGKEKINNLKNDNDIHYSKKKYAHEVSILKNTILYEILKEDTIMVNSRHNYHIEDSGINTISAYSKDNIIEAIENPNKTFQLGFQWHPETLEDNNSNKIFTRFIDEAIKYKKRT